VADHLALIGRHLIPNTVLAVSDDYRGRYIKQTDPTANFGDDAHSDEDGRWILLKPATWSDRRRPRIPTKPASTDGLPRRLQGLLIWAVGSSGVQLVPIVHPWTPPARQELS
jgi:hypothetical protein